MFKNKFNLRNVVTVVICLAVSIMFSGYNSEKTETKAINKSVKLSFEGKKYDNLYLVASTIDNESLRVYGTSTDGYNWTFVIPDSISVYCRNYSVRNQNDSLRSQNEKNVHAIDFQSIINNDTLKGSYFNFEENENLIELKGKFDTTHSFENKIYIEELDTTIVIQTIVSDVFSTPLLQNRYLREFMQTPMFSFFYDRKNPDKTYEEFLIEYADKIEKNPNSLYYISYFASTSHFYKSKEDIENLFKLFSPEAQNSMWGIRARRNFEPAKLDGIDTIVLQNPLTKEDEKIILEPTKHTLLCFSASWCAPCRKKIPLLKEIYEKTKGSLNLVYITTDEGVTIDDWNALMEKENIEWRSLWLTDKNLKSDWQIFGIPDYLLVYPNENTEKIVLNEEKDIQELYSILNK